MPAPCPQSVLDLTTHLKGTGTGDLKLEALIKLGMQCAEEGVGAEDFLARAKLVVPDGTYAKILAYVESRKASKPLPDDKVEAPVVETPVEQPVETPSTSSQDSSEEEEVEVEGKKTKRKKS